MKKIGEYWIDENNNTWSCAIYSKKEALKNSKTLVNSRDCCNCSYCSYCSNCRDCRDCRNCHDCSNCHNCRNCRNCHDCHDCSNCHNCRNCRNCHDCSNCHNCRNCHDCNNCREFSENPQRYTTSKIGSRASNTTFYWLNKDVIVVCGCFIGTLPEFEKRVNSTYGDKYYGKTYKAEIKKVKYLMK